GLAFWTASVVSCFAMVERLQRSIWLEAAHQAHGGRPRFWVYPGVIGVNKTFGYSLQNMPTVGKPFDTNALENKRI
ncbi:MAG: hypothetical protein WBF00_16285, partial [Methylocella sp.]